MSCKTLKKSIPMSVSAGIMLGLLVCAACNISALPFSAKLQAASADEDAAAEPSVRNELERLKEKATDQAHVMVSVSYHFNNLWFAGQHSNWPLAKFYLSETRSHLRWAVRVIPIRKDLQQRDVDLRAILEAVENSPLKQLEKAIELEDRESFVDAYRFTLDSCYACHKAADKPYLRPQIPQIPADPMINFDPSADRDEPPSRFQLPE